MDELKKEETIHEPLTETNDESVVDKPTMHPEVEKILNYVVPKRKIHPDVRNEEPLTIGRLIDVKTDIRYDGGTRKPMMMHGGVLAILDGIGAELMEPKLERTGSFEYQVTQGVRFGDGSVFYATGECSDRNANPNELSGKFPVNQAHIRAINKAIIRGIGLYSALLTEEESDDFKEPKMKKLEEAYHLSMKKAKEKEERAKEKEEKLVKIIDGMIELIALPSTDDKYPNMYIHAIREDSDYLLELKNNENIYIGFVAGRILKNIQKDQELQATKDKFEEQLAEAEREAVEKAHEEAILFQEIEGSVEVREEGFLTPSETTSTDREDAIEIAHEEALLSNEEESNKTKEVAQETSLTETNHVEENEIVDAESQSTPFKELLKDLTNPPSSSQDPLDDNLMMKKIKEDSEALEIFLAQEAIKDASNETSAGGLFNPFVQLTIEDV